MGLLKFLLKWFRIKPGWNGTPEMFLAMVLYMQKKNSPRYSRQEVLQWGEVLQKMINVKLDPYTDFNELLDNGTPDYSIVNKVDRKASEIHQRIELKKALYGENVDLGDDDIMTSNEQGAVFARKFVKGMSEYVNFPDEEKRKLDEL